MGGHSIWKFKQRKSEFAYGVYALSASGGIVFAGEVMVRVGEMRIGCVKQSVGVDDGVRPHTRGWGTGGSSYRRIEPSSGLERSPQQHHPPR
jgi:hypothetical protein